MSSLHLRCCVRHRNCVGTQGQVEHMPQSKNKIVYTPILRMFKGDYLAEAGLSNLGDITINFIKRF